ncbi:K(+)-transporting ATPase subunit C [Calothrix sp. UHCC 0171]|uniref:K(+)-transporting ATPase subunit C n=1 Tax=Calothrix sp. UHCC 0171 TaxID=3110245 RepID=UPI002B2156F5|nr:K(+)-transporting ATPase subunit C [Calothrix sp. UHCC 0171]MEA5571709.1 K(+)-transporting ATPase subunit C [Calothrix sp. UHCC 0171]
MLRNILKAIRISIVLWLLTAIIYPLLIFGVGQLPFLKDKANGSIVYNLKNQAYGSTLIGQVFTSDKYFHPRPSMVRYSQGKQGKPTGVSGASNLAPTNPKLINRVIETANELRDENLQPTADLIYTSASGLDPHISIKSARIQLERVARARNIKQEEIIPLINRFTDSRFLGIFGEPGVNVLRLNYTLDLNEFNRKQNQ